MSLILFSIPVHENNDVIRDTIDNIRQFAGAEHPIMLHVSRGWPGFDHSIATEPNVWINPQRWPTAHAHSQIPTHVTNFCHAVDLGLPFTHMVIMHTSELLIRQGMPNHIAPHAHSLWFTPETQPHDARWPPGIMVRHWWPGFAHYLGNLVEGSWYARDLFADMSQWIKQQPALWDAVHPQALEECLFPTLTWHLAGGRDPAHPFCAFKHDTHFVQDVTWPQRIVDGQPVVIWQPNNFVYNWQPWPSTALYSIKRVSRDLDDPVRDWVRSLNTSSCWQNPQP
jgi:hypothetical protein